MGDTDQGTHRVAIGCNLNQGMWATEGHRPQVCTAQSCERTQGSGADALRCCLGQEGSSPFFLGLRGSSWCTCAELSPTHPSPASHPGPSGGEWCPCRLLPGQWQAQRAWTRQAHPPVVCTGHKERVACFPCFESRGRSWRLACCRQVIAACRQAVVTAASADLHPTTACHCAGWRESAERIYLCELSPQRVQP